MRGRINTIKDTIYMVALQNNGGGDIRWYCTGQGLKPFVTFNLSSAKREVTKLKHWGYSAAVVTVNVVNSSCLVDIKEFK